MPPLISVIIPTYNRLEKVMRAIESVLAQDFSGYELIVVDDGSDDGTEQAIRGNIAYRDIRFIRLETNAGVSRARNIGAAHARGTWLAFLDSDDIWHKDKLSKQAAWIGQNPSFRIVQTREIWIRKGKRVNPPRTHIKKQGDIFEQSLARCMITPSSVMLEKSLFEQAGRFNESLPACEDYDLWLRIACTYPIGLVEENLLTRFGGHADQLSSTVEALDKFRIRALIDLLASRKLNAGQQQLTQKCLAEKAGIVANGFKKRGKAALYERYKKIAEKYAR